LLEDVDDPSVEEISVESITGRISVREDKRLGTGSVRELVDRVEGLEEQIGQTDGVCSRAVSSIGTLDREGDVGSVAGAVEIPAVPALREVHLQTEAILAESGGCGKSRSLRTRGFAEAGEADGSVSDRRVVVGAAERISRDHTEASREGRPLGISLRSRASASQVVDRESTLGDDGERTVRPLVVQIGVPVSGEIDRADGAGGAGRLKHVIVNLNRTLACQRWTEVRSSSYLMHMARVIARCDERVHTATVQRSSRAEHLDERGAKT